MNRSIALAALLLSASTCLSQTLQINITNIRDGAGNIRMAFYSSSKAWDDEKPSFIRTAKKKLLANGRMQIVFSDLKPGVYGIAILDDENANEKMDYGWVLPKEGFGFSDYYHTGMTRPKFEKFDFTLASGVKTIEIKVRYL